MIIVAELSMAPVLSSALLDMQIQTTEAGDIGKSDSIQSRSVLPNCTGTLRSI